MTIIIFFNQSIFNKERACLRAKKIFFTFLASQSVLAFFVCSLKFQLCLNITKQVTQA